MPILVSRASAATVSFSTPQEIIVSHVDDSIKIGDGTRLVAVTSLNGNELKVSDADTHTILNGFFAAPAATDAVVLTYTDATKASLSSAVFKSGGASGTTLMTITVAYPTSSTETYVRS